MDNMLDRIRLKWDLHGEENEGRVKRKVFALSSLENFPGRVHIVPANAMVERLHGIVKYKANVEQHAGQDAEWQRNIFYVNLFFRNEQVHFTVQY